MDQPYRQAPRRLAAFRLPREREKVRAIAIADACMQKLLHSRFGAEWGSTALVFMVSMLAGRLAAEGMNAIQWAGAVAAVLGSITIAVAVRVWGPDSRA